MSCRKPCKECPWTNTNQHSIKFISYFDRIKSVLKINTHKCHMISSDVWGYQSEIDEKNVCIGSKKQKRKN